MLAIVSGAVALPAGTLPRISKERVSKEEPVVPVNHNYHKFSLCRRATEFFVCLLREIMLSTMTFKMVSSAWLMHAVRFNGTESSRASIAIAGPMGFLSLSRKEHHFSIKRWKRQGVQLKSLSVVTQLMKQVFIPSSPRKQLLIWNRQALSKPCIPHTVLSKSKLLSLKMMSIWHVINRMLPKRPAANWQPESNRKLEISIA